VLAAWTNSRLILANWQQVIPSRCFHLATVFIDLDQGQSLNDFIIGTTRFPFSFQDWGKRTGERRLTVLWNSTIFNKQPVLWEPDLTGFL
jgi:hypothetical protein